MTCPEQREQWLQWIKEAVRSGAIHNLINAPAWSKHRTTN